MSWNTSALLSAAAIVSSAARIAAAPASVRRSDSQASWSAVCTDTRRRMLSACQPLQPPGGRPGGQRRGGGLGGELVAPRDARELAAGEQDEVQERRRDADRGLDAAT